MVNYQVDDLDAMLAQLRDAGVPVESKIELGRFAWTTDPDGYRIGIDRARLTWRQRVPLRVTALAHPG
jgi:predicted enzyme related to lactoylglutathione lyase